MNHIKNLPEKLDRIKSNDEDYNWYPTTKEMIRVVFDDVQNSDLYENNKLLDIGAGDGNLFSVWDQLIDEKFPKDKHRPNMASYANQYFAIEKSHTLLEYLPKNVVTIGTDFHHQTLIDKQMNIIFCNPPYSEFESWATKAILEANSTLLYLIIPDRWKESGKIKHAIERRLADCKVIHSDNFLNAPRAARANIDILKIDFRGTSHKKYGRRDYAKTDPFEIWFEDSFQTFDKVMPDVEPREGSPKTFKEKVSMTIGANLIERMENLYIFEIEKIGSTYKKLCSIDPFLLREFNISLDNVKKALKEKLSGLKHKYWKELFDNLTKITDRLTSKSRDSLLKTLQENLEVDFSANNAYMVVLWAIKNANTYYDQQLIDAYENLVNQESVDLYKSNKHFGDDSWRFAKDGYCSTAYYAREFVEKEKGYYLKDKLDYRIVTHRVGGIHDRNTWSSYDRNGLQDRAYYYIQDICTIAKNLGYEVSTIPLEQEWSSGKQHIFYTSDDAQFMTVKAFKNGNLHFKFNQEFLRKWNVEFGRLKGWINNKNTAAEEMNISIEEMNKLYECNFQIEKTSDVLLLEKVV